MLIRQCEACGAEGEVGPAGLSEAGSCQACRAPLPPLDEPLDVDAEELEEILGGARVPVLIDFWAAWCGPCQIVAPEVHQAAIDLAGRALVLKVDTDENPELARRFGVRGIPHFAIVKGGQVVFEEGGVVSHEEITRWLVSAGA